MIGILLKIEKGRGFVISDENKETDVSLGTIFTDSVFTPIRNVKYFVEDFRVEQKTDYEKLVLEIETDGSIHPKDALTEAAKILIHHFMLFSNERISIEDEYAAKIDDYDEEFDDDEPYIIDIFSNLINCNLSNKSLSQYIKNTIHDIIDDLDETLEENNEEDNIWVDEGNIKYTELEIKTKQQCVNIYVEFNNESKFVRIEMLNKTFNPINKKIRNNNIKTQNWRFKKHNQRQFSRKTKKYEFN